MWNVKNIAREMASLALIMITVFAIKSSVAANYTVPTGSMKPTIEPGDKLFVNKMAYDIRIPFTKIRLFELAKPKRGDVIVFECPYDSSTTFVKRLIGLPGDLVEVRNGFIRINGKPVEVSLSDPESLGDILKNGGMYQETLEDRVYRVRRVPGGSIPEVAVRVPQGHYFAVGDNRDESLDSRSWGFFPEENLWGRARFVYFSAEWPDIRWSRIGLGLEQKAG